MKKADFWNGTVGIFYIVCFLALLGFIAYLLYGPGIRIVVPEFFGGKGNEQTLENPFDTAPGVLFSCAGEKGLKAEFLEASVRLALSDGRQMTLPQTISASGARYANTDESFVFWNNGDTAFVEENRSLTYANCALSTQNSAIISE